jgi:uncharacterized protein (TIGR03435 family)
MSRKNRNVDDYLERELSSVPSQMEAGLNRILVRLRSDPDDAVAPPITFEAGAGVRWRWLSMAAAILLVAAIGTAVVWRPPDDALFRVVEGDVYQGETIRSNGGVVGSVLALVDGSRVEMRSQSELSLERATDGLRIRLHRGGIIVNAAKQRAGRLYVQTKDVTVSVVGTVFLVNAEESGSRIAVIEGEVRVQQGRTETNLRRGEQLTTDPDMPARSLGEAVAWSRSAREHVAVLRQPSAPSAPASTAATPTEPRVGFDVVTIRPSAGGTAPGGRGGGPAASSGCGNGLIQIDPSRVAIHNVTLQWLIVRANNPWSRARGGCQAVAAAGLLSGGPEWVRADKWDIEAAVPAGYNFGPDDLTSATDTPLHAMLRTMLKERFGLRLRTETTETPVYLLTVTPGGPKFNGPSVRPDGKPVLSTRRESDGTLTRVDELPKGTFKGTPRRGAGYFVWDAHVSMAEWAGFLIGDLGRPVLDRTGLSGDFRFHLEVDETGKNRPRMIHAVETIGLRFDEAKAPVEVWIVEHAERPTPN